MVAAYQSYAQNAAGSGATCVVTKPTGTVDGDLLIAIGITNGTTIVPVAGGAAWVQPSWSLGGQVPIWTKKAASEGASFSFNPSGGALQFTGVMVVRVNGQHATTPFDTGSGHSVFTNLVLPGVTSAGSDRLLLQIVLKASAANSWTPPAGPTERFDAVVNNLSSALGDQVVGAGATGSRTWTPTDTGAGAVGYMIAVAPTTANSGSFTGAYDFSSSGFTGDAPDVPPGAGTFTGGYQFSSSGFAGAAGPSQGTFTGGYQFNGSGFTGEGGDPDFLVDVYPTEGGRRRWGGRK
jgi:hypothetical protein